MDEVRSLLKGAYNKIFSESGEQDETTTTEYHYAIKFLMKLGGGDDFDWVAYFKKKDDNMESMEFNLATREKEIEEGKISTSHLPEDAPERQFWASKEEKFIEDKSVIQKYKKELILAKQIILGPGN